MKCPHCQNIIDDDSRWCDQCGKELKFCPECRVPRKGNSCPACGELLVGGDRFFGAALPDAPADTTAGGTGSAAQAPSATAQMPGQAPQAAPQPEPQPTPQPTPQPAPAQSGFARQNTVAGPSSQPAAVQGPTSIPGLRLSGNGMMMAIREGIFGRRGGIFPELATCSYVSGTHGEFRFFPNENCWGIRDCGSTNGTFINGTRLEKDKWYILKAGGRLRIATLDFNIEQA